jgi:thymidine phosphorylase
MEKMLNENRITNQLLVKNIGIDTYRENILFMRYDCEVCLSEGFTALTRIVVTNGSKSIIATLNVVTSDIISHGEAGLSLEAMKRLGVKTGDPRIAKLAGAPRSPASGLEFHAPLGKRVEKGDVLYTIHAETEGELQYASNYAGCANTIISIV